MRGTVLVYEGADVNASRLSLKMQHAAEEEKKKMKKSHWLHERGQLLRCCRSRISPTPAQARFLRQVQGIRRVITMSAWTCRTTGR